MVALLWRESERGNGSCQGMLDLALEEGDDYPGAHPLFYCLILPLNGLSLKVRPTCNACHSWSFSLSINGQLGLARSYNWCQGWMRELNTWFRVDLTCCWLCRLPANCTSSTKPLINVHDLRWQSTRTFSNDIQYNCGINMHKSSENVWFKC
jgi:hypothetical protein